MVARRRYMYEWGLVLALLSLVLGGVGSEATTVAEVMRRRVWSWVQHATSGMSEEDGESYSTSML